MNLADQHRAVFGLNPVAWLEIFGRIEDKEPGSDPNKAPRANWLQRRVGEALAWCLLHKTPVRLILYKPRQRGCSTITVGILYVLSRLIKMKVLVIGGQASQTDNLWKILRHYAKMDQFDWSNVWEDTQTSATCSNGSLWERETAGDKEAGRSGNYHAVIATEVARWPTDGAKNAAEVLSSVLNCVGDGPGTVVVMESTAQGPVGVFPDTWKHAVTLEEMKAGQKGNGYIKIFAPWFVFDNEAVLESGEEQRLPGLLKHAGDEKAIQLQTKHNLSAPKVKWYHEKLHAPECGGDEVKRDREYPSSPEDGFQSSQASRFSRAGLDILEAQARQAVAQGKIQYGLLHTQAGASRPNIMPCAEDDAELVCVERPKHGCSYLITVDNMTGESHAAGDDPDTNAVIVLRDGYMDSELGWRPPEPVASISPGRTGNRWDADVLADFVAGLSRLYGGCIVVPEANRGEWLIKELRDRHVNLMERKRPATEIDAAKPSGKYGWQTTKESKTALVSELARHIRSPGIEGAGLAIRLQFIIDQCRTFVRHPDGTEGALKVTGCHDDFVIVMGIALMCKNSATQFVATTQIDHFAGSPSSRRQGGRREVW